MWSSCTHSLTPHTHTRAPRMHTHARTRIHTHYTCTHTHTHTCFVYYVYPLSTYTRMHIHTLMHACIYTRMHTGTHKSVCTPTCTHAKVCTHTCTQTRAIACAHMHAHTSYIHTQRNINFNDFIPQVPNNRPLSEYSVLQPVVNQDTEYMVMDNPDLDNPKVDSPEVDNPEVRKYTIIITSIKILITSYIIYQGHS